MTRDLVVRRDERLVLEISDLRNQLDRIVSIDELQEASSRLRAVDAYAKARGAREITDRAAEARIWVERRAGELAIEQGLRPADIVREWNVKASAAGDWVLFASVSEDDLRAVIEAVRAANEVSVYRVKSRLRQIERETSHTGITQLVDGRFRLNWKHAGVTHSAMCKHGTTLKQARGRLQRLKRATVGAVNNGQKTNGEIALAYGFVRRALDHLDSALAGLPPDAREFTERAMAALHEAEDQIGAARRIA